MCRSIAIKRNYFSLSDYFSGQLIKSQLVFDMYIITRTTVARELLDNATQHDEACICVIIPWQITREADRFYSRTHSCEGE